MNTYYEETTEHYGLLYTLVQRSSNNFLSLASEPLAVVPIWRAP